MIKVILTLFLIGHFIGDFYLQSSDLAKKKNTSLKKLFKHSALYLLSIVFFITPIFSFSMLKWALVISLTHFIIDFFKSVIKKKVVVDAKLDIVVYLLDQTLHITVIIITTMAIYLYSDPISYSFFIEHMLSLFQADIMKTFSWILVLVVIIQPTSVTIKKMLNLYRPPESNRESEGHPNAGAFIGILERLIILLLLTLGQYSAIGFVLTAKSIARYNKIVEDPMFSEYFLLGTLLSTLLVVVAYILIF